MSVTRAPIEPRGGAPVLDRISVVGVSGSGKSTLAGNLAARLGAPVVELDAMYHQSDWQPTPDPEFRRRVGNVVAMDRWVIEGGYSQVRDLVWGRATTIVWLDLPRPTVMRRIVRRTLRRMIGGTRLWNGNRERPGNLLSRNAEVNIILWAWRTHARRRRLFSVAMSDDRWSHLAWIRLRTPMEVDEFLRGVAAGSDAAQPAALGQARA